MKMACSSVCGSPSSLCVQSWVSDSVAMATCSEQSGSAVSISMPRRPVVGDSYRRYVIPVAVSGGSLRKGLVSAIAEKGGRRRGKPALCWRAMSTEHGRLVNPKHNGDCK